MNLTRIGIQGVRNLQDVELEPASGANLVYGPNASGKTSLLEAIYLLAHARSFRTPQIRHVISTERDRLQIHGQVEDPDTGQFRRLGIERSRETTTLRLDQQSVRQSSRLAQTLPLQLLTPESIRLLEQGPGQRRRFLDWGLFHVEHAFHSVWNEYAKALKQRNAALRSGSDIKTVRIWDAMLISKGEEITRLRRAYVEDLGDGLQRTSRQLLGFSPEFVYRQGWRKDIDLATALNESIERDRQQGATTVGPHRADLACLLNGTAVQDRFSRGQLKMLVCAMRLAQSEHMASSQGKHPVFLVDDIAAELDPSRRTALLSILRVGGIQVFLTATEPDLLDIGAWDSVRMFHVEHGKIAKVV